MDLDVETEKEARENPKIEGSELDNESSGLKCMEVNNIILFIYGFQLKKK